GSAESAYWLEVSPISAAASRVTKSRIIRGALVADSQARSPHVAVVSAPVSPYHASRRRHTTPPRRVQHQRRPRPLLAPVETRARRRGDSRGPRRAAGGEARALCGRGAAAGAGADSGRAGGSHR